MSGDLGDLEESVVARPSSVAARLIVAACLVVGFFAAGQWLLGRGDDALSTDEDAAPSTTILTTTSVAAATSQPEETSGTVDKPTPLEVSIGVDVAELALGAPEQTRVAYGTIDGGLRIVDLSNGASADVGTVFPLGMTTNYLVGSLSNIRQFTTGSTSLVIINLDSFAVATFYVPNEVSGAVSTGNPDRMWLHSVGSDGQSRYQLLDLRDGGLLLETLDAPVWSWMIPTGGGHPPFLNVLTNGVYEVIGTELVYLGPGTVVAASAGGALWTTCDESFVCSTLLITDDGSIPLEIGVGEPFSEPNARVSPDGRFVAAIDTALEGVTVIETATGTSSRYEIGHVWTVEGLVFIDHRLLVWSEAALKVIDAETGEITHLGITPNYEFLVSSR